ACCAPNRRRQAEPDTRLPALRLHHRASARYQFAVAQIFNLPSRRFVIGRASITAKTLDFADDPQVTNLRYSAARQSRNQNGPRLWSKTQPQRVGIAAMLRLVLRTQPRYENSSRLATILGDTDRVQLCDAVGRGTLPSRRRCSPLEPPVPGWEPLRNAQ